MTPITETIRHRAQDVVLSPEEISRYSRHLLLPEVGSSGQRSLKAARVLVIGAGGLGAPASLYLAAAGVGTIGLVDFDTIDVSNLQRQVLYASDQTGTSKVEAAGRRLWEINPALNLDLYNERFSAENAREIAEAYDLIIDGTDNFPTRYLASDTAVLLGKPYIYGSVFRFEGQLSVFYPGHGPCYRCLFPSPPPAGTVPSCAEGGVLGVLPGIIGVAQAGEALKLIAGYGEPLIGRLQIYDALGSRWDEFRIRRDPGCPACGEAPTITSIEESAASCQSADSRDSCAVAEIQEIDAPALRQRLQSAASCCLLDVRSEEESEICAIPGSVRIPLHELAARFEELPRNGQVVAYCKNGVRSRHAAAMLCQAGFADVCSLRGGILAWIAACDPSLPSY